MAIANGNHADPRLKITKVVREDLDGVIEWHASFNPRDMRSYSDALIQFSDMLFAELGYRIDLTKVEIKHENLLANGFVYRERG